MMLGEFRIVSPRVGRDPPESPRRLVARNFGHQPPFSSIGETDLDQADLRRFQPFSPLGDVNDHAIPFAEAR